jgi:lactoylglutathione lyase
MIPVTRLFEAHLWVSDLETSIAFYRDRVGLEPAHVTPGRGAAFFWIGERGNTMLGLWATRFGRRKTPAHVAFAAPLDDVIAAPFALHATGITPLDFDGRPTDEPVVLAWMPAAAIYFHDPDGHLLEYIAMLAEEPRPSDGVVTWREWSVARVLRRRREPQEYSAAVRTSDGRRDT